MPVSKYFISDGFVYGFRTTFTQMRLIVLFALAITGIILACMLGISLLNIPIINTLVELRNAKGVSDFADLVRVEPSAFIITMRMYWISLTVSLLLMIFLSAWIIIANIAISLEIYDKGKSSVGLFFSKLYLVPKIMVASLLFLLLFFVGLVFFVIPSILWTIRAGQAFWIIVDKNEGILKAFEESFAITKGYSWQLFGWNIAGFFLMGISAGSLASFITLPTVAFAGVHIYRTLMDNYKD
jgi:hypothetical protein